VSEIAGAERSESRKGMMKFLALPWIVILVVCLLWGPIQAMLGIEPAQVGEPAPEFALAIVSGDGAAEGDRLRLADLRGKPVVIDFWASWCPPCRRSMPMLTRVYQRHRTAGVHVIGINVDNGMSPEQIAGVARSFGGLFPSVHDATGDVQRAYQVTNLPTTVVIDGQGVVRHLHVGVPDEDDLNTQIASLLR
jgi:thiol-disulfide isomerase/thioredoxin